jgi:plasmid stabilization system protein ParE
MQIRWTPAAVADLQHISDYLGEHHPRYRQPTLRKLYEAVVGLKKWPERGRIGREEGTREFLFSPLHYVVVYRLTERSVEVLRIYHTAQDRP